MIEIAASNGSSTTKKPRTDTNSRSHISPVQKKAITLVLSTNVRSFLTKIGELAQMASQGEIKFARTIVLQGSLLYVDISHILITLDGWEIVKFKKQRGGVMVFSVANSVDFRSPCFILTILKFSIPLFIVNHEIREHFNTFCLSTMALHVMTSFPVVRIFRITTAFAFPLCHWQIDYSVLIVLWFPQSNADGFFQLVLFNILADSSVSKRTPSGMFDHYVKLPHPEVCCKNDWLAQPIFPAPIVTRYDCPQVPGQVGRCRLKWLLFLVSPSLIPILWASNNL